MKTAEREGSCLALTDLKERQDSLEMVMNNHFFSVSLLFSSNNPLVILFIFSFARWEGCENEVLHCGKAI
jgi:hypothetical protein